MCNFAASCFLRVTLSEAIYSGGSHFSSELSRYFFSEIISAPRPLMRAKEKDEKNIRDFALHPTQCKCSTHNVDQRNSARRAAMKNYMWTPPALLCLFKSRWIKRSTMENLPPPLFSFPPLVRPEKMESTFAAKESPEVARRYLCTRKENRGFSLQRLRRLI